MSGIKHDQGKPDYSLIPPEALDYLAQLYTFGARKYAPRNWEQGIAFSRLFAALMRHAWAWKRGQDLDPETRLPHMASVAFCAFAIMTLTHRKMRVFDDRSLEKIQRSDIKNSQEKMEAGI